MTGPVILVVAVTVAIAAAVVAKVVLVPLGLVALAGWFLWARRARPIVSATSSRRWLRWLLAGALAIGAAVAIPAIDGGELDELWWTVMAVSLLGGIGLAVTGVVLVASDRAHRVAPKHETRRGTPQRPLTWSAWQPVRDSNPCRHLERVVS